MLIDIHVHIARNHAAPGLNGRYYPTPEEMIGYLDEAGIDMAVVMTRANPECAFRMVPPEDVLEMCSLHPKRSIPFCGVDPRMLRNSPEADFRPMLQYYKDCGCKGIGEYIPNIPFDDPYNMNVFRSSTPNVQYRFQWMVSDRSRWTLLCGPSSIVHRPWSIPSVMRGRH